MGQRIPVAVVDGLAEAILQDQTFKVAADRPEAARFWSKANSGRWEADAFDFIRRHAGADLTFVDIGAWIGPITLYASRHAGRVLAVEPDPVAHKDLVKNVSLNATNVDIWQVGVDRQAGQLTLYAAVGLGQSTTSTVQFENAVEIRIPSVTFVDISKRIGDSKRVIIKIDIEGHEYSISDQIIEFACAQNAPMHLSFHPRILYDNIKANVGKLKARRIVWQKTSEIIGKLSSYATLTDTETGRRMTKATLFQFIFPRTRVHNFTLEVTPRGQRKVS